jgi:hypothetical protein
MFMTRQLLLAMAIGCVCSGTLRAGDANPGVERSFMGESQLKDHIRSLRGENRETERLRAAKHFAARHSLSSLQVKSIVEALGDDTARLEFALEAYPNTIDPENFYEVYDGFKTFSKVMRLHDGIRELRQPQPARSPWVEPPKVVADNDLAEMIKAISKEGIDSTRQNLARQIIGARANFSTRQIKQILALFSFESSRLELAKYSFNHVLDPENFFMVSDVFAFSSSKDELARFLESRRRASKAR